MDRSQLERVFGPKTLSWKQHDFPGECWYICNWASDVPSYLTCQIFSLLLLDFDLHQKPDSKVLSLTVNSYLHREHANRDRDGKVRHSCRYTYQGQRNPVLTSRLTWWRGEGLQVASHRRLQKADTMFLQLINYFISCLPHPTSYMYYTHSSTSPTPSQWVSGYKGPYLMFQKPQAPFTFPCNKLQNIFPSSLVPYVFTQYIPAAIPLSLLLADQTLKYL